MNERIKNLSKKAWLLAHEANDQAMKDEGEELTEAEFGNVFQQKFAESIVKECVGVCLDRHNTWRWDNELDSDSGPRDCARSIQEHFGVKE